MASRLVLPKVPRIEIDVDPREWVEAGRRGLAWRPPRGAALRRALWRGAMAPYWLASDVPAPQLPARDEKAPPAGLAGDQVVRTIDEIGRRVWLQRALTIVARSAWLVVLIGCLWLLLELQGGPALDFAVLPWIAGAIAIPGLLFAALARPTRRQVALMLDRSFGLQERMATASENLGKGVPADGERARLVYLQMADAANVVGDLRRFPVFAIRLPVREIVVAIVCALVFASLFFMRGVGGGIPPVQAGAVPPFTPASERMAKQPTTTAPTGAQADAPTVADVQQRAERSNQARQDLDTLAKALNDHAVTNAAANAMQRGDYSAAANDLRDLAQDADKLSPSSREDLAQDLDKAASQMSDGSQQLADATRQAADGLRQGNEAAQNGMRNLGDAVEKTGSEVASQQDLAQQMQQAQAAARNDANAGPPSQSSSGDQSSDQASPGGAQQQSGSDQSGAQQSDSGQNADAQPGDASQSSNAGQNQGDTQSGGAQNAGQQQSGQSAQSGEPGAAQQPGQEGGSQPAQGGQPGEQGQQQGPGEQGDGAQQGAGAGSGSDQNATDATQAQNASPGQQQAGNGTSPDPNVANGTGGGGQGTGKDATTDPHEAITLSRAPNSNSSVQTSSNNGGSNAGAGPGASVSSGTSTQGAVGEAGPDSNRVPADYRSIVEDYFSDPEGSS